MTDVLPAEQGRLVMEQVERIIETEEVQSFRFKLPIPAGQRLFEARTHPLTGPIGDNRLVSAVVRDITDQPGDGEVASAT